MMSDTYVEENLADGTITLRPATVWRNPTASEIRFDVYVGTPSPSPVFDEFGRRLRADLTDEERTGLRPIVVPPGAEVKIAREHDGAIHDERCALCGGKRVARVAPKAPGERMVVCFNPAHAPSWQIVGGSAPKLVRVTAESQSPIHPAIDDAPGPSPLPRRRPR